MKDTKILAEPNGFWNRFGLAKLVRDLPGNNILHTTILQAMRITHPGITLTATGPNGNGKSIKSTELFAPRELGHVYPHKAKSMQSDLTDFHAYTPMRYCFEICAGFLAALQKLQPNAGWVCYIVSAPEDTGHCFLHATGPNIIFDPMQLAKDPAGMQNRYIANYSSLLGKY